MNETSPTGASARLRRQKMLADLIRSEPVASQEEATEQLAGAGFAVTQATVSRDLDHLGAIKVKRGGVLRYALPDQIESGDWPDGRLQRIVGEWVLSVEAAGNLLVMRDPARLRPSRRARDRPGPAARGRRHRVGRRHAVPRDPRRLRHRRRSRPLPSHDAARPERRTDMNPSIKPKKVVLAYSGGLDTSIILKWLQTEYGAEVVTFTADLGQGEEVEPARQQGASCSASSPRTSSSTICARSSCATIVFPMFRANTVYEGQYLLGTSIARPLIAKRQIEIARAVGADAVCHGATGKGNDQVRFELGYYALEPDIRGDRAVARMGLRQPRAADRTSPRSTRSRSPRTRGARRPSRSTPTCSTPRRRARCSRIPAVEAPEYVHQRTISPEDAPDKPTDDRDRLRGRRSGRDRRRGAVAGGAARPGSTSSATTMASAGSTWSRTASSA